KDATSFDELLQRVRAGNQDAARELVERYEPAIRRAVRYRLGNGHLNAVFDSMDICQSVLGSFFIRAASGQYEIAGPQQHPKLRTAMRRNKLAAQFRRQRAQRRDHARVEADVAAIGVLAATPSPSRRLAAAELLEETRRRLSGEELQLMELRQQ